VRPLPADPRIARRAVALAAVAVLFADAGCAHHQEARRYDDDAGPPPVQVVTTYAPNGPIKPLPPQDGSAGLPPAYADPAIVRQQVPEEPRYVQAYDNIGKPKIVVFVNRTITGELVPVNPNVTVRAGLTPYDDRTTTYLHPGQYDAAQASSIDYELIENLLTEDLSADGKVMLIAPLAARQRLGDDEVREVQAGRPQMLGELATKLNADVLVQVTARPSQQTDQGLGIRLVAEALNTHGGQAIAFAAVDVPPPLTRATVNEYVRFVARKLMDGMSGSWESMAVPPPVAQSPAPGGFSPPAVPPVAPPAPPPPPPPVQATPAAPGTVNPMSTLSPSTQPAARSATSSPLDLPPPP
jgi:hypothetical protein